MNIYNKYKNYKKNRKILEVKFIDSKPDKKQVTRICKEFKPRGSIVIFPSFLYHRIKKVTRGERNSLVCWSLGKPWQ